MTVLDSLPSRPLKRGDIKQLRARDTVAGFIELQSRIRVADSGLRNAVALIGSTVVDLSFEDETWHQTVLARGADKHDHVTEALGQLDGH